MPLADQFEHLGGSRITAPVSDVRRCRVCGCTDADCSSCVERTGMPCSWVEPDLCSACEERPEADVDLQAAAVEAATPVGAPALAALPWTRVAVTVFCQPEDGCCATGETEVEHCVLAADGLPVATVLGCPDAPEVARLIAAAPELLAAAECALKVIDREACAITYRELQAAVAKAKGA